MARSAFTDPAKPRQSTTGCMGPLRGTNKAIWCVNLLPTTVSPTMSTVAVSVLYWEHTAAVCLLVDGIICLRLPTPPPSHPPTPYTLSVILQQLEKYYLKTQQCQLGGRISYKTIAT